MATRATGVFQRMSAGCAQGGGERRAGEPRWCCVAQGRRTAIICSAGPVACFESGVPILYNTAYRPAKGLEMYAHIDDGLSCTFVACSRPLVACAGRGAYVVTVSCQGKSRSLWAHAALVRSLYCMGGRRIVRDGRGAKERLEKQIQLSGFFDPTRSKPQASPGALIVLYGCTTHRSGCSGRQGTPGEADPVQRIFRPEPKACSGALIVLYGRTTHRLGCSRRQGTPGEADPVQPLFSTHAAAAASILWGLHARHLLGVWAPMSWLQAAEHTAATAAPGCNTSSTADHSSGRRRR
jgi:hypothetical protein